MVAPRLFRSAQTCRADSSAEAKGEGGSAAKTDALQAGRKINALGNVYDDDLPHPGPLPMEREKRLPRFGNVVRRDWPDGFWKNRNTAMVCPLPGGEETGEGER